MCFAPQRHALFRHLNFQKWSERTPSVLYILTSKCASRHNGVHFFNIWTSKSGPNEPLVFCTFWLWNVLRATTACTFSTSEPPKVVQTPGVFNILTLKCASRHNSMHFFDIWTSKSGPNEPLVFCTFWLRNVLRATTACTFSTFERPKVVRTNPLCFVHFDFEMCFAPQRRALFRDLNFQKWSERTPSVLYILTSKCASRHNGVHFFNIWTSKSGPNEPLVFCTFWLGNVLRATAACTFSTSQLPKVVRTWCALYILTWKCASRHNGVQFFISHLASWLRTRRFSEPTFRPSGAPNHWKNTVFRDFPTFSCICILLLLTLSLLFFFLLIFLFSLPLPCSAFHLSILSEVWLLNFLRILTDKCEYHVTISESPGYLAINEGGHNRNIMRIYWAQPRICLVGGLEHEFYFSFQLGMSSSQLTNIFQRGWSHQPDLVSEIVADNWN